MTIIQYKLLNNGRGVILTRQPEIVESTLTILFDGAPDNATAIIKNAAGTTVYRPTAACTVPASHVEGEVEITVVVLGKDEPDYHKWTCEGLKGKRCESGMLISPNDMNLPDTVARLQQELHDVRNELSFMHEKYCSLEKRLSDMMEGYDLT